MESKLRKMFETQYEVNVVAAGKDWISGFSKDNRRLNYARAIYMEAIELIDSYPWKWWKNINQEPDISNAQIEAIDIWHFLMSLVSLEVKYRGEDKNSIIKNSVSFYMNNMKFKDSFKDLSVIEISEHIAKHAITLSSSSDLEERKVALRLLIGAFEALNETLLNGKLVEIYNGKSILNKFRQENGYRNNTYIKIWNGKEDNVYMLELITQKNISNDSLYEELDKIYKTINNLS